jgi:AcrR family transcriptional regulator
MGAPSIDRDSIPQAASGRDLKQDRAIRTQGLILNASAQAFADQGFLAVTVADLADRAGVTKGAVYFHYANKDALAVAVTEEFYRRLAALADDMSRSRTGHLNALVALLLRTAEAFRDDVVIQAGAQLQLEQKLIKVALPVPFVGFTQTVQAFLERARADAEIPAGTDPVRLAAVIAAGFYGSQHISWVTSNRADIVERTRDLIDATLGHLAPGTLTAG